MIPGKGRSYLSSDSVCKASIKTDDDDLLYPPEFLHTLQFSGIPNHDIKLKEGTPIMLLRNLNQSEGLSNGTRLIVTPLGKWSIRGFAMAAGYCVICYALDLIYLVVGAIATSSLCSETSSSFHHCVMTFSSSGLSCLNLWNF
ncbi:hypothetical protein POM88_034198 [Heracleum sosnowskyi]|uniref:DNA helicase Pif1-like 2B domain-containing protein n=1 Tax=Heracleum sosnowskyi TaxID=360622 RepID=A0AAD8HJ21_9APIA|nr:hypothetical protein POM88_034197 [Heracleum sosnowskyi]KAK1368106.1 hypothetical protein POM88_034198 [Heracleum sosnowskyi]